MSEVRKTMNKQEFIAGLNRYLGNLPAPDRDEILYDYEEHFRNGISDGKTEEEIASSLGDPRALARQFNANFLVQRAESDTTAGNTLKAVLATLGLGFFNLVFILGPFIGLAGVLFGLFAAAGAILISGVAVFAASVAGPLLPVTLNSDLGLFITPAAAFFTSVGLICLGLLFFIANFYLARLFFTATVRYLKFNLNIIKGA